MGENIVDVEMQLGDEADAVTALLVHRKNGLGGELHILSRPYQTRVDRAGSAAFTRPGRRREAEFDDRRQVRNDIAEALVAHIVLEIEQTVLDRPAPFGRLGLTTGSRD